MDAAKVLFNLGPLQPSVRSILIQGAALLRHFYEHVPVAC